MRTIIENKARAEEALGVLSGAVRAGTAPARLFHDGRSRGPEADARAQLRAVRLDVRAARANEERTPVTVIVPLAAGEPEPSGMLAVLPAGFEVILARGGTRASSMNEAALIAKGHHLWFLHADTTLEADAVKKLLGRIVVQRAALHFFDLRFDGGGLMRLTDLGVRFRSRVLGIPFGDQALCICAATFRTLGGYVETAAYGEDHLLVRHARRAGIPVLPVGATIATSARKYRKNGWFQTTLKHWRLTLLQILRDR